MGDSKLNPSVDVYWEAKEVSGSSGMFTLTVPEQAYGQYGLTAIGFNNGNFVDLDSIYVPVSTISVLDSISIQPDFINVFAGGGIASAVVVGHFTDGITRRLSNHSELTLQTADPSIASVDLPGIITGHVADTTRLTAMFQGEVATAIVVVLTNDVLTGIYDESDGDDVPVVPQSFELEQNYPNPFNPETKIKYHLPADSDVVLRIFNLLGQEVTKLSDERKQAGIYEAIWNGRDRNGVAVSTGVYLVRIHARNFVETKKMLLIR